jgi:RNA polymerase sigma-70 factor (ECF subfamily)
VAEPPDELLLEGLRRGDGAAFAGAYQRHSSEIFRFLRRLCGRRELAEDLFQETWIRLARHGRTLRADTNLRAWLFTVARNLFRSHARWAILDAATTAMPAGWWYLPAPGPRPDDDAVARDTVSRLATAVERLPVSQREVLLLVVDQDLPIDDVARILGLTHEAVRQRLHRAREQLARTLEGTTKGTTK